MTKHILIGLFVLAGLMGPAQAHATAGLTSTFYIASISDGYTAQGLIVNPASPATADNSSTCNVGSGYAVAASDTAYNEKVAILMAAYLANRPIQVFLNRTTGDCSLDRPRIVGINAQ